VQAVSHAPICSSDDLTLCALNLLSLQIHRTMVSWWGRKGIQE